MPTIATIVRILARTWTTYFQAIQNDDVIKIDRSRKTLAGKRKKTGVFVYVHVRIDWRIVKIWQMKNEEILGIARNYEIIQRRTVDSVEIKNGKIKEELLNWN